MVKIGGQKNKEKVALANRPTRLGVKTKTRNDAVGCNIEIGEVFNRSNGRSKSVWKL